MKKTLLAIFLLSSICSLAQDKFLPSIKQGTKLNYMAFTGEQDLPILITIDSLSTDLIKMGWNIEGLGNGGWVMKKKSLDSGNRGWWSEPAAGVDQDLADEQTVLLFSKASWEGIQKDKKTEYDMQTYSVKTPSEQQQLKLNGKVLDVILLEGQNGSSHIWVLNDARFPAILKIQGNTMGPDLEIRSID